MIKNDIQFDELVFEALSLPFSGWDFSILGNRWKTNEPYWNYPSLARQHMQSIHSMLDLDTGGGELLSSLAPFPPQAWATESYPPNIPVAKQRLQPYGVQVISEYTDDAIPLPASSLDLVLDRHGSYSERELLRLLKPGGIFLTEQVGGENCFRLNELLQDEPDFMYSYWTKDLITRQLREAGFELLDVQEDFPRQNLLILVRWCFICGSSPGRWQILAWINIATGYSPSTRVSRHRVHCRCMITAYWYWRANRGKFGGYGCPPYKLN